MMKPPPDADLIVMSTMLTILSSFYYHRIDISESINKNHSSIQSIYHCLHRQFPALPLHFTSHVFIMATYQAFINHVHIAICVRRL